LHIVFTSQIYLPTMGGSVVFLNRFARAFLEMGHEVTVLTSTAGEDGCRSYGEWLEMPTAGIRVCRQLSRGDAVRILRTADRVVMIEMSLTWFARIALAMKVPIVTHHTHFMPLDGRMTWLRRLQKALGCLVPAVGCSRFIARQWGPHVGVVPNPYDDHLFGGTGQVKDIDYLFVGRVQMEKGPGLMVLALMEMREDFERRHGRELRFAIMGEGPEKENLKAVLEEKGMAGRLVAMRRAGEEELAAIYNRAKVVVIPSLWEEPFGLIALEGLACGCRLVCSDQPGLREASGGVGHYFQTGDLDGLVEAMWRAWESEPDEGERGKAAMHLAKHRAAAGARTLLAFARHWNNRNRQPVA